jgi:pimeloyl-ACP methyl ester carboxylesterase
MENVETADVQIGSLLGRVYSSLRPSGERRDDRPAFVLLHGIGVSHRYLSRLHNELAKSADTYSIDLPGFYEMPRPERALSVEDHAAFVLAALERLGVQTCVLIGHSMGTQFAVEAALQQPERVSHVVLMGPVVDINHRTKLSQAARLFTDSIFFETASSNYLVVADYFKCGPRWYSANLPAMMGYPIEEKIRDIAVPVLVVRGGKDPVAPRDWCQFLVDQAQDGRLLEVPWRGHVVQHTGTPQVAEAIRELVGLPSKTPEKQS